jgi:restriction system protein
VPVPDYQSLMRPVLALTEDGEDWTASSIREAVISEFQLTAEDVEERLPSGRDTTLRNRVGWAITYLYRAGLLARPRRAVYGDPRGAFAILEAGAQAIEVTIERVAYDAEAVAAEVRDAGLPGEYADKLLVAA